MNKYLLSIVIEKDQDGYFAFCPELQGCYSQGDSYEEALTNIQDAIVSISKIVWRMEKRFRARK